MRQQTWEKEVKKIQTGLSQKVVLRMPREDDGARIWELARGISVLDLNSAYSYLMLCKYFPDTCVVAEHKDQIIGFVTAFRLPKQPDTIFVWQVGVSADQRGNGIGKALLKELIGRQMRKGVDYLEATVSPSNLPSQSLFRALAQDLNTDCVIKECFSAELFPVPHEPEWTFRIGPFQSG